MECQLTESNFVQEAWDMEMAATLHGAAPSHVAPTAGPAMPLALTGPTDSATVLRVTGSPDMRKHLEHLGIVSGAELRVVSQDQGNTIIVVKGVRLALDASCTRRIMVKAV
jgi:ferrous iron transport protein A